MGAGSWGTTFAQVLCDAGTDTVLWCRRPAVAATINATNRNQDYLPDTTLPSTLRATADPRQALAAANVVVLAVPAQTLRQNLAGWVGMIPQGALLVSLMKGIELDTGKRMTEVIAEVTGWPSEQIAVITGPNLAREIAARQYAATVVACADQQAAENLQKACHTGYFRPYTNPDVLGCELGGAVKNVIAIAVGIAVGMGLGDNTTAMLITRGLAEIRPLAAALRADPNTIPKLPRPDHLGANCTPPVYRHRTLGED